MNFLKKWLLRLVLFTVFIAGLVAAAENSQQVSLTFLDYKTWEWPISWWVLAGFVLGTLFGVMLNVVSNTRLRLDARKATKEVAKSNQALDRMKASSP